VRQKVERDGILRKPRGFRNDHLLQFENSGLKVGMKGNREGKGKEEKGNVVLDTQGQRLVRIGLFPQS